MAKLLVTRDMLSRMQQHGITKIWCKDQGTHPLAKEVQKAAAKATMHKTNYYYP
ncbi:hypothetical protein COLO4_37907 [Corchorus olitorius]|uniref:Uncharacterized protein n=1 Tax=Corchorus olitorius TaxID=93759 RepID=A0A1R3FY95_9ROSI|nr:hypothetical protein COLO4_37907 [Corchorus olitorius]